MITSKRRKIGLIAAAAVSASLPTSGAFAALMPNGLVTAPRVTNNNPGSTLTIVNSNTNPGNVTIDDRTFSLAGPNRHDGYASLDSGATAYNVVAGDSFTISGTFNLTAARTPLANRSACTSSAPPPIGHVL